jgi:CheY-like chemotaxis protein
MPHAARGRSAARPRPLVLIADDHAHIRELIRVVLSEYAVAEAKNGPEALSLAHELHPDIVILDIMLPLLSGLEVLTDIRADPELERVGVIVMTAQPAHREEAVEAGADAYFEKPFDPDELVSVIEEVMARRQ